MTGTVLADIVLFKMTLQWVLGCILHVNAASCIVTGPPTSRSTCVAEEFVGHDAILNVLLVQMFVNPAPLHSTCSTSSAASGARCPALALSLRHAVCSLRPLPKSKVFHDKNSKLQKGRRHFERHLSKLEISFNMDCLIVF